MERHDEHVHHLAGHRMIAMTCVGCVMRRDERILKQTLRKETADVRKRGQPKWTLTREAHADIYTFDEIEKLTQDRWGTLWVWWHQDETQYGV